MNRAFTLIELLVVVAIIGVLAGMLLPAITVVKDLARSTHCASRLRQVGLAAEGYSQDWEGAVVPANMPNDADPVHPWGWPSLLSPYLETDPHAPYAWTKEIRCPTWNGPSYDIWKMGWGINPHCDSPGAWWVSSMIAFGGATRIFMQARVQQRSTRVFFGDAIENYRINKVGADFVWYGGTQDLSRHRGNPNYLFFDNHIGKLPAAMSVYGIADPTRLP